MQGERKMVEGMERHIVRKKTRPDTVLSQSRAGGQGLCLRSFHELGRSIGWTDGRMGQRTDGPTDGQINGPT